MNSFSTLEKNQKINFWIFISIHIIIFIFKIVLFFSFLIGLFAYKIAVDGELDGSKISLIFNTAVIVSFSIFVLLQIILIIQFLVVINKYDNIDKNYKETVKRWTLLFGSLIPLFKTIKYMIGD